VERARSVVVLRENNDGIKLPTDGFCSGYLYSTSTCSPIYFEIGNIDTDHGGAVELIN
jgi:hypothetical protein